MAVQASLGSPRLSNRSRTGTMMRFMQPGHEPPLGSPDQSTTLPPHGATSVPASRCCVPHDSTESRATPCSAFPATCISHAACRPRFRHQVELHAMGVQPLPKTAEARLRRNRTGDVKSPLDRFPRASAVRAGAGASSREKVIRVRWRRSGTAFPGFSAAQCIASFGWHQSCSLTIVQHTKCKRM